MLHSLLIHHHSFIHKFEPNSASPKIAILTLISESLLSSHVSSRHIRFHCMECLLKDMPHVELVEATSLVLGEVLICQKDANKKSRDG